MTKIEMLNDYLDKLNKEDNGFRFKLKQSPDDEGLYFLYDANECYYFDYAYYNYISTMEIIEEFGLDAEATYEDSIHNKLEAIIGDVVDWYDNVTMMFRID